MVRYEEIFSADLDGDVDLRRYLGCGYQMLRYGARTLSPGSIHVGTSGLDLIFVLDFGDRRGRLVSDQEGGLVDVARTGELCTLALTT